MSIELRLLNSAGVETHPLPDFESCTISPIFCEAGSIEFTYPIDGVNFDQIRNQEEFRVAVYLYGVLQPELEAWIKDADGDDVEETGSWKFTGWLANGRLSEAVVYPEGWPNYNVEEPGQKYVDNTPGYLWRKLLINEAQARGALAGLFLDQVDATGDTERVAWARLITQELKPGTSYLSVMSDLYEEGICEFQIVGNRIRVYNFQGLAVDRTTGSSPVVFQMGRDILDAPRKRSSRERANAILAEGSEGLYIEKKDQTNISATRRIEAPYNYSESDSSTLLNAYASVELQRRMFSPFEVTHGLTFDDPNSPKPITNFNVGDWVYSDTRAGLERLRVRQWVVTQDSDGTMSGSVVLNDIFQGRVVKISKQLAKVVKGKAKTGTSKKSPPKVPQEIADNVPPAQVTGVVANSTSYVEKSQYYARIAVSWSQVSQNDNGSAMFDLAGYRISYRQPSIGITDWGGNYWAGLGTSMTIQPFAPGVSTEIRVRAEDKWGNNGEWSTPITLTTAQDTTPPPVPSAPTASNLAGLIRGYWDGTFVGGAARPADFAFVEMHFGTVGFTPSVATLQSQLVAAGAGFKDAPLGTNYEVVLIAVDALGNRSAASARSAAAAARQVVSADVFDGAIGTEKLADLAVVNAKIAALAVNNAKIGDLEIGKVTGGIANFEVQLSGRIATALTGARTEMNSLGFYRFDASGNALVAIDGTQNLLTGIFKTARTGRRIEIGASGQVGRIDFYSPSGSNAYIQAWTESTGKEALQMGVAVPNFSNTLWNRVNYNHDPSQGEYATYRSGTHEFMYDASSPNNGRFVVFGTTSRSESTTRIRFQIDDAGTQFWYPIAGTFRVYDRSDFSGVNRARIIVEGDYSYFYHMTGGATYFYENINGSIFFRYSITDTDFFWQFPNQGAYEVINVTADSNGSHFHKLINTHNYGVSMQFRSTNTGTNGALHFKDAANNTYVQLQAGAFTVPSSAALKSSIRNLEDPTDMARAAKVKRYRRKAARDDKGKAVADTTSPGEELGLLLEETPADLIAYNDEGVPEAVNLYSYASMILGFAQAIDARLTALESSSKSPRNK